MSKGLEKYEGEKNFMKTLFAVATWVLLFMLRPWCNMLWGITDMYKVSLTSVFFKNIILCIIGFIAYKVYKSFEIKIGMFLKIYIGMTLAIHVLTLVFIVINKILMSNSIYFKGKISFLVLLISFVNMISTTIILFTIGIKIIIKRFNNYKPKVSKNIIILFPLIVCLFLTLSQGILGLLFSVPEEIEVVNKDIKYNIRVDQFLRARDEASFIYNKSINFLLMRRLNNDEIPTEILAENNYYYSKYR